MIQSNSHSIIKFDRPYQTIIAQVKVRIKMLEKIYDLSQNHNCLVRLSVLPFVLTSVCIIVITAISLIFEVTIKGVGNILLSPCKKDCKAMYGFKQLFISLPLKVLPIVFVIIPLKIIIGAPITVAALLRDPEKHSKYLLDAHKKTLQDCDEEM